MTKPAEMMQARQLYVHHGLTAIAIAGIVGVHEKQVRRWRDKYKWLPVLENNRQYRVDDLEVLINEIAIHLQINIPEKEAEIWEHLKEFLDNKILTNEKQLKRNR